MSRSNNNVYKIELIQEQFHYKYHFNTSLIGFSGQAFFCSKIYYPPRHTMQNTIQIFPNEEFGEIEVMMIDAKPHFPASECAAILGYATPRHAVSRHCRGGMKRAAVDSLGREQQKTYIPEGDLYHLSIRSKLPVAVRFESWI